jgi:hypothetical protein
LALVVLALRHPFGKQPKALHLVLIRCSLLSVADWGPLTATPVALVALAAAAVATALTMALVARASTRGKDLPVAWRRTAAVVAAAALLKLATALVSVVMVLPTRIPDRQLPALVAVLGITVPVAQVAVALLVLREQPTQGAGAVGTCTPEMAATVAAVRLLFV